MKMANTLPETPADFVPDVARRRPLIELLVVGLATILSLRLAGYIRLPYSNPEGIVGLPWLISYNPANNILHYLIWVLTPSVAWIALRVWWPVSEESSFCCGKPFVAFRSAKAATNSRYFRGAKGDHAVGPLFPQQKLSSTGILLVPEHRLEACATGEGRWNLVLAAVVGLAILAATAESLTLFQSPLTPSEVKLFHEGEHLTPAMTWRQTGSIWTGSFFVHGAFYDLFGTALGWWALGHETIGAARVAGGLCEMLAHLLAVVLLVTVAVAVRKERGALAAVLLGGTMFLVLQVSQWVGCVELDRRDLVCFFGLTLLAVAAARRSSLLWFIVGLLCSWGFFYTLDRGAYLLATSAAVLVLPGLLGIAERRWPLRTGLFWLAGNALGWLAALAVFGRAELAAFFESFLYLLRYKDYFDSCDYGFHTPLHFVAPLLIAVEVLGLVAMAPVYRRRREVVTASLHVLMVTAAVSYFRYGLGRCDVPHLRHCLFFAFAGAGFLVFLALERVGWPTRRRVAYCLTAAVAVAAGFQMATAAARVPALLSAPARIRELARLPDAAFLSDEDQVSLVKLELALSEVEHPFVFSSEPGLYYLLKKRPCTRFYVTWFGCSRRYQEQIVEELESARPAVIVYSCDTVFDNLDTISNAERFYVVDQYVRANYRVAEKIGRWQLVRRVTVKQKAES